MDLPQPAATLLYNQGCAALAARDYPLAASLFRRSLMVGPGFLMAAHNLGVALQNAGDSAGAIVAYRRCVAAHPDAMDSGYNLASQLGDSGEYEEAIEILQALVRRFPDEGKLVQNLAILKWRARLDAARRVNLQSAPCRVLVACMPKSGSTFLADVLAKLPGMRRAHLVPDYGRREHELDLEQLINHQGLSYVSQLHLRPSRLTRELLEGFAIRSVFLFRNIWDVMASLRDHLHAHSLDWSMAQVDPEFRGWDEPRQYEFLANTMMPWFIDFYVSWNRESDRLPVSYEQLMAEPVKTIADIAAWAGLKVTGKEIEQALGETGRSRTFNKGGSGRGTTIPAAARAHVLRLAAYYPEVDFEPLLGR